MRWLLGLVISVAVLALDITSAAAERRVALVVGNGAYVNTTPLSNPKNDARDISAALKETGFDVVEALDADKLKLDAALRSFTDKLTGADVALFFYAGHGLQVGAQNYLVPTDAKLERERDLEFEAVRLDFVLRQMEIDRDGKTSIVILDACRDNPLARNLARSMGTRSVSIGRGLAAAATGLGTFIAFATQPGNVALDGAGANSPFTSALARHMRAKGRNLNATMIEVRKDVVRATDGKQVPWDHSALTGEFYFVPEAHAAAPAPGSVTPAPAASSDDITALKERLAKLEAEAKLRDVGTASPGAGAMMAADGIKLAELRARAAGLDDLVKDLQKKLMSKRMEEGKAANADERMKLMRESSNVQLEWTRRGLDLKKLREEIAALEGKALPADPAAPAAETPRKAADLPIIPKPRLAKDSPDFDVADNVRVEGAMVQSLLRSPRPAACRDACEKETGCVGVRHGRKIPVMGNCELFSRIDERHEDDKWRSGIRKTEAARSDDPKGLPFMPSRSKNGFDFFDKLTVFGKVIKSVEANSADGCMVVCRNTQGCAAASFSQLSEQSKPMCIAFESVQATKPHLLTGTSVAIVRLGPK